MEEIRIVFDGPPGPEGGRFVEVENQEGASIRVGEWRHGKDGFWGLWIPIPQARIDQLEEQNRKYRAALDILWAHPDCDIRAVIERVWKE